MVALLVFPLSILLQIKSLGWDEMLVPESASVPAAMPAAGAAASSSSSSSSASAAAAAKAELLRKQVVDQQQKLQEEEAQRASLEAALKRLRDESKVCMMMYTAYPTLALLWAQGERERDRER